MSILYTVEFLIICTPYEFLHPPFSEKNGILHTLIIDTHKNEIINVRSKHCEMAFLTITSVNKHVLLALGLDCMAKNEVEIHCHSCSLHTVW